MYKTKLWHVNANKLFSGLSEKDRNSIAPMLISLRIKKKGVVYSTGCKADTVYMLKEGRVKITRFLPGGRELIVDILEPGDIFGELTIAGEEKRETNAVAMEDSSICAIKRKDFEEFIARVPDLSLAITKWIGLRLMKVENRLENMVFNDVRTRLIAILKDLVKKYGVPVKGGMKITINLSHMEMASLIGAARETVTLELNNLKRDGEILTDGKYFILPSKYPS